MNVNVFNALKQFFGLIWSIFEAVPVPGTDINCAELTIGFLGCNAFIVMIKKMIDSGGAVGFRSAEGKQIANEKIFKHRAYYGGSEENHMPHGEV